MVLRIGVECPVFVFPWDNSKRNLFHVSADVSDLLLLERRELAVTEHARGQHFCVKLSGMCGRNVLVQTPISRICCCRITTRLKRADVRLKVLKDMSSASLLMQYEGTGMCTYCQSRRLLKFTILPHTSHCVSS